MTRYIEIKATAPIKATKIVRKEENRIEVNFSTIAFIRLPTALTGATIAGQPLTGATIAKQKNSLNNLEV